MIRHMPHSTLTRLVMPIYDSITTPLSIITFNKIYISNYPYINNRISFAKYYFLPYSPVGMIFYTQHNNTHNELYFLSTLKQYKHHQMLINKAFSTIKLFEFNPIIINYYTFSYYYPN